MYKKFHLFAAIFCISLTANAQGFKIHSYYDSHQTFYEYQEDSLWGIKYQDDVCIWPQFEELKQATNNTFFYKEHGLWGIMCPTKRITDPLFDECSMKVIKYNYHYLQSPHLIISKKDKKYGVIGLSGTTYIETKYDSIKIYGFGDFFKPKRLKKKKWQWKYDTHYDDIYFAVLSDEKWLLLDILGNVIYNEFQPEIDDKSKWKFGKLLEKYEINRFKNEREVKKQIRHITCAENDYQKDLADFFYNPYSPPARRANEFGNINEHIYETAFIDTPWLEDSQEAKLERDSTNVFVWRNILYESMPTLRQLYEFDETLDEEMLETEIEQCKDIKLASENFFKLVQEKGYPEESAIYKDAQYIPLLASHIIERNTNGIIRVQKAKKHAKTMETLNSIASLLANTANAINTIKGNKNTSQPYNNTSQSYSNSPSNAVSIKSNNQKAPYSLSENQAKNTDSRTYANYDSMLIKMRTGNTPYNDADRRNWQSKMKELRTKWEKRGRSFPHSQNENWIGK